MLFDSFPPVLQIQLRRFEYDFVRDTMIKARPWARSLYQLSALFTEPALMLRYRRRQGMKDLDSGGSHFALAHAQINDRYEFPEVLDLDIDNCKYLSENVDRSVRNKYRLHSVLVHSGGINGGHYYAYINPSGSQWLKFDDERVRPVMPCAECHSQDHGPSEQLLGNLPMELDAYVEQPPAISLGPRSLMARSGCAGDKGGREAGAGRAVWRAGRAQLGLQRPLLQVHKVQQRLHAGLHPGVGLEQHHV